MTTAWLRVFAVIHRPIIITILERIVKKILLQSEGFGRGYFTCRNNILRTFLDTRMYQVYMDEYSSLQSFTVQQRNNNNNIRENRKND